MPTKEVTIDLGQTTLRDVRISRRTDGQLVDFSVEGTVHNVDDEVVENVMLSQQVDPVSITLSIDDPDGET
ncbi:hypothetical protein BRD03_13660 [Halobacteriales archaeon QS_9_68_17]|nr:MAG: hypothetical protein BRD03_13660 [Halobacteriales archaeon QS_9_68_17]